MYSSYSSYARYADAQHQAERQLPPLRGSYLRFAASYESNPSVIPGFIHMANDTSSPSLMNASRWEERNMRRRKQNRISQSVYRSRVKAELRKTWKTIRSIKNSMTCWQEVNDSISQKTVLHGALIKLYAHLFTHGMAGPGTVLYAQQVKFLNVTIGPNCIIQSGANYLAGHGNLQHQFQLWTNLHPNASMYDTIKLHKLSNFVYK